MIQRIGMLLLCALAVVVTGCNLSGRGPESGGTMSFITPDAKSILTLNAASGSIVSFHVDECSHEPLLQGCVAAFEPQISHKLSYIAVREAGAWKSVDDFVNDSLGKLGWKKLRQFSIGEDIAVVDVRPNQTTAEHLSTYVLVKKGNYQILFIAHYRSLDVNFFEMVLKPMVTTVRLEARNQ
jgi:hypothetical protein